MAKIVLVVNHELFRIGLRTVLSRRPEIGEVIDITNLQDINNMTSIPPDILLYQVDSSNNHKHKSDKTDLLVNPQTNQKRTGKKSGIEITMAQIDSFRESFPRAHVGLISTHFELEYLLYVLYGRAHAYLPANVNPNELLAAVQAIDFGGVYIHSQMMAQLPPNALRPTPKSNTRYSKLPQLSEREHEVLNLLVKGYTNKEVSKQLYLSPKTVEAYRAKLYTKLGARTRADLFSRATENGLVTL